jgi:hypothetical protein
LLLVVVAAAAGKAVVVVLVDIEPRLVLQLVYLLHIQ